MLKLQEGKYYRTRDGRKLGPAYAEDRKLSGQAVFELPGPHDDVHLANGTYTGANSPNLDIIAEWIEGPVVAETVTKTRIVPGTYGRVSVHLGETNPTNTYVSFTNMNGKSSSGQLLTADELDAAAAVLSALAKGLRDA